jgi:hypothetical protein
MNIGIKTRWVMGLVLSLSLTGLVPVQAQNSQPAGRGLSSTTIKDKKISVDYGRPSMNGRDMLAMAPDGFVWRMGKDDDTSFSTDIDLMFGDIQVAMGSYKAETKHIKGEDWSLILSKGDNKTEIPFTYTMVEENFEVFTIDLDGTGSTGSLIVKWGGHRLNVSFMVK